MLVGGLETREGPPAVGTWQGQPRSHHRTARGGAEPLPGGRGSGPPRPVGAVWPAMVWPSHVAAPDLPGEAGAAGATRELSSFPGDVGAPVPEQHREGPETTVPSCQARAVRHVPQKARGRLRIARR
jgi:hypothetical protein